MKSWALAAAALATLPASADASVTWSFYETGISCFSGRCSLPPQPFVFATFTLPEPTSAGTARWGGFPGPAPVYTGDDFTLSLPFTNLSSGFSRNDFCNRSSPICDFDIVWSATSSGLSIALSLDAVNDNVGGQASIGRPFGSFGGPIATDSPDLGGCNFTQCEITGFWQSDLPLPEPISSVGLFLTGLFGTWLARRRYLSRCQFLGSQQRV
jgi:hypothetical protein